MVFYIKNLKEGFVLFRAKFKKAKGFTLVEIIVVIAIIGVLAAVLTVAMLGYLNDAKRSRASTDARAISLATQELIFSKYAGQNIKAALAADPDAGSYSFSYTGSGTSDPAVLEILEEIGEPDYENGFVVFVNSANTSTPSMVVYVYITDASLASSCDMDVEPDGAFPETEMAKFE